METMQEYSLKPIINELERLFKIFNNKFYNDELETPTITIIPSKNTLGHCTTGRVWKGLVRNYFEINISSEYLNRSIESVCETLLHEMAHLSNLLNNIEDCNGYYHNKKYKKTAEEHGLSVSRGNYGWSNTELNDEAKEFVKSLNLSDFGIKRTKSKKFKNNSLRYQCPRCGVIIRSTKPVNVICADCNCSFIRSDK